MTPDFRLRFLYILAKQVDEIVRLGYDNGTEKESAEKIFLMAANRNNWKKTAEYTQLLMEQFKKIKEERPGKDYEQGPLLALHLIYEQACLWRRWKLRGTVHDRNA